MPRGVSCLTHVLVRVYETPKLPGILLRDNGEGAQKLICSLFVS